MNFVKTKFDKAFVIEPKVFGDHRGFFSESYSKKLFAENGITDEFVQDNHSLSVEKGVLRGLHFQLPPNAQAKLVRVIAGSVYDVIVDLRKDSATFGQWEGFELSADNKKMLYVPKGFAHAFCTLEENTEFVYKVDSLYAPESDSGIAWNDPTLAIKWPIEGDPIISEKDDSLQKFEEFKSPF